MVTCYLCKCILNRENQTKEHIIPYSLGSDKTSKNLICNPCNRKLGHDIDHLFDKHLGHFYTCLGIKNRKGNCKKSILELIDGEKIEVDPKIGFVRHTPKEDITIDRNTFSLKISAKNQNQAENYLKKYTNFFSFQNFSIGESTSALGKLSANYFVPVSLLMPAISKLVINLYLSRGGSQKNISHLVDNLYSGSEFRGIYLFYREPYKQKKKARFNHIFHHVQDPDHRIEYFYIEIFEALKYIVIVDPQYKGLKKKSTVQIDPQTRVETSSTYPWVLTSKRLLKLIDNQDLHEKRLQFFFGEQLFEVQKYFNTKTKNISLI